MSLLLSDFYPRADAVLVTGNQNITGIKTFNERINVSDIRGIGLGGSLKRIDPTLGHLYSNTVISLDYFQRILSGQWRLNQIPTVNGTGILLSGDVNVVFTNGAQIINGQKTFNERIAVPEIRGTGTLAASRRIDLEQGQLYAGTSFVSLDYFRRSLSGSWTFDNRPTVNGTGVLLQGEASSSNINLNSLYSNYFPYLASWFTTNSAQPNGLHICGSQNGYDWNILTSRPYIIDSNELRDPSIIQLNNKWAIAFTENAFASDPYNRVSDNSGFFGLIESTNLAEWSYRRISLSGLLANIGVRDYNRLWAPEWFKEDNGDLYLTFSINRTGWGNHNRGHMVYIVQATDYNLTGWANLRRMSGSAFPFFPPNSTDISSGIYDMFIEKTGNIYYGAYWDERNIETRLASSTNLFTGWNIIASGKSWYGTNFPTYTSFPDGSYKEGACIRYFDGKWRLWITDVLGGRSGIYSEGLTPTGMSFVSLINAGNYRLEHGTIINSNDVANMIYYSGLVNQYSNQNISGLKNFRIRPTVNGTGVLLQGEAAAGNIVNVVFTTGSQTITGPKNFTARPTLSGVPLITTGDLVNLELNIEGALSASTNFNGNREIKAVPVINTNYGGTSISGFLENMFFPYQNASLSLNDISILTYGVNSFTAIPFNGSIIGRDDNITGIAYRSGDLILNGPVARTTEGSFGTVPIPFGSTFRESSPAIFNTQLFVTKNGQPETRISNNIRLRFEPRYYYGVSSNPNLETNISQLTAPPVSTYTYPFGSRPASVTHTGFSPNAQYIYFAYPSPDTTQDNIINWGNTLSSILDANLNFEYISQYTQLTPFTLNYLYKSLKYRIYRSNDLITVLPGQSLNLIFTFGS